MADWLDNAFDEEEQLGEGGASSGELFEHFRLTADPGLAPIRLDRFMASRLQDTSRNRVQLAIKEGYVHIGDKAVKASYIVRPGDVVRFVMPYPRRGVEIVPQDIPLDIVYEDESLLVVNKPAGMVVHPGHGHFDGTLVNALAWHLGMREGADVSDERMGILVHRIDKDTSGLLLVAKTPSAQLRLAKQFYEHSINRLYTALVWGNITEDEGTVDASLIRDPSERTRFKLSSDPAQGKRAVTHYRVLERFGYVTLVECRLETGRTHQIRVHLSSIGHPLFADEKYGGMQIRKGTIYSKYKKFIQNCFEICPRQALHAGTLGFVHPETGKTMNFSAPLPGDMTELLERWRRYCNNMPSDDEN